MGLSSGRIRTDGTCSGGLGLHHGVGRRHRPGSAALPGDHVRLPLERAAVEGEEADRRAQVELLDDAVVGQQVSQPDRVVRLGVDVVVDGRQQHVEHGDAHDDAQHQPEAGAGRSS